MNVSELAKSAGLSPSGVRWYERIGVLPAPARQPNGYREYTDRDRSLVQLIATLRRLGLSPAEAGGVATLLLDGGAADPKITEALSGHREAIRRQQDELRRLDTEIADLERTIAGTAGNTPGAGPVSVLFLCNSNSGRSQLGEALLRQLGGEQFSACSAGMRPREVSPFAIQALRTEGIDWSSARAKSVEEFRTRRFDYVITLSDSARSECPPLAGPHNSLHWSLADPARVEGSEPEKLAAYLQTLEEIRQRLQPFCELALIAHKTNSFGDSK